MSSFQPWLGNFNPTDQQKNEYIRLLKAALVDQTPFSVLSGSYTGDGTSNKVISLSKDITPLLVVIGRTGIISIAVSGSSDALILDDSGPSTSEVTSSAQAIKNLTLGSFTVNSTNYTNENTFAHYYFVVGA